MVHAALDAAALKHGRVQPRTHIPLVSRPRRRKAVACTHSHRRAERCVDCRVVICVECGVGRAHAVAWVAYGVAAVSSELLWRPPGLPASRVLLLASRLSRSWFGS
jgi:hypothetical protein